MSPITVVVTKDGKEISEPMSPDSAFKFVLDHQGQSYEYAMKVGGYGLNVKSIEKTEEEGGE